LDLQSLIHLTTLTWDISGTFDDGVKELTNYTLRSYLFEVENKETVELWGSRNDRLVKIKICLLLTEISLENRERGIYLMTLLINSMSRLYIY
jgi:hypothetical protein